LAEALKQREEELNATRAVQARADAEQFQREQLARTLEERTRDLDGVRAERDTLAEALKQRGEELNATRAEHQRADMERQAALVDIAQHRSRADRDQAMYQTEIEGLRQTLDLQRRDHQDELVRRSYELDELTEQYRRLRDQLGSTEPAFNELESARAEIGKLRQQLAESERLQREISSVLNGLGLRFDLGP
jgi:chromosome segregation ATPase